MLPVIGHTPEQTTESSNVGHRSTVCDPWCCQGATQRKGRIVRGRNCGHGIAEYGADRAAQPTDTLVAATSIDALQVLENLRRGDFDDRPLAEAGAGETEQPRRLAISSSATTSNALDCTGPGWTTMKGEWQKSAISTASYGRVVSTWRVMWCRLQDSNL